MVIIDCRCLQTSYATGVQMYTKNLLNAIFSLDKTNEYVVWVNGSKNPTQHLPKWDQPNVRVVATRIPNKLLNLSLALLHWPRVDTIVRRAIGKEIRDKRDTRYSFLEDGGKKVSRISYLSSLIFFSPNLNFTSLSSSCRHILTIHDLSFEHFPECFTPKLRLGHRLLRPRAQCQRADVIVVPSEHTRRDVVETYGVNPKKIVVIPPMLSPLAGQAISYILSQDQNVECRMQNVGAKFALPQKFILFIGTLEPRKNVEGLLQAFIASRVFEEKGVELVVAGSAGWKSKKLRAALEKTAGVRYIGYVQESQKSELYDKASLFAYPSLYEGYGLPVAEALQHGLPVITSNCSSLPELGDKGNVTLVNPYNVSEMAGAIRMHLSDPRSAPVRVGGGEEDVKRFLELLHG